MQSLPTSEGERAALLKAYRALQPVHEKLHERLIESLPHQAVLDAAEELDLVRRGQIDVKGDFEMELLVEYALYREQEDDTLVIDAIGPQLVREDSAAEQVLRGMSEARFSIFQVKEVTPGVGVELWEYVRSEPVAFVLEETDEFLAPGEYFMGRLMEVAELRMLVGSIYPVPEQLAADLVMALRQGDIEDMSTKGEPTPPWVDRTLMRAILEAKRIATRTPAASVKIGRNDPCPCGSGKKYKKCCGAV